MQNRIKRQGFTLIELLIALLIFSVLGFTVTTRIGGVANQSFQLEQRTVAHWIAQNQIQRLRLTRVNNVDPLKTGTRTERVVMAQRDWLVKFDAKSTDHPALQRVELAVFELAVDGAELGPYYQTVTFLGQY